MLTKTDAQNSCREENLRIFNTEWFIFLTLWFLKFNKHKKHNLLKEVILNKHKISPPSKCFAAPKPFANILHAPFNFSSFLPEKHPSGKHVNWTSFREKKKIWQPAPLAMIKFKDMSAFCLFAWEVFFPRKARWVWTVSYGDAPEGNPQRLDGARRQKLNQIYYYKMNLVREWSSITECENLGCASWMTYEGIRKCLS